MVKLTLPADTPSPTGAGMHDIIAKRLREFRQARGVSQEELASRAGLSTQAVSNIENRHSRPSVDTLITFARELDVPVASFFEVPFTQEADLQKKRFLDALSLLDEADRRLAADILDAVVANRKRMSGQTRATRRGPRLPSKK
ncbi:hypothetical protein TSH58p_22185 (plasmid) [Azospirillum sp. TSH58]|uniref:helix-turn-helix domain-containing protein n=1 Tax=Azospirillum sp. TSH58 TaxID=664962 RepID=UPI000D60282F|nr:helix-turn-helix domain-containing protein [Azospirillum sp. TSH58]AWJ86238.1 hypothetical protein TSH58p_22185 [Azospirillum sp. TSH58]